MSAHAAVETSTDLIARRIAEVVTPIDHEERAAKKAPLTWEEEELAFYEPKRSVAVEIKQKADAREALLQHQMPYQWNALCEVIKIRCESINTKAHRTVLRAIATDKNHLEVRREDDQCFVVQCDPEKRRVKFSGKALGYDRDHELVVVQTHDNVDTTAWFSSTTLTTEQTDDLSKTMISVLMRFEQ